MDDVQGELLTAKFAKKIRKGREEIQAPTLHTHFPKPTRALRPCGRGDRNVRPTQMVDVPLTSA